MSPRLHRRLRLLVLILGESFMLFLFFAAPRITLESFTVTLGSACALFMLWRYCERP